MILAIIFIIFPYTSNSIERELKSTYRPWLICPSKNEYHPRGEGNCEHYGCNYLKHWRSTTQNHCIPANPKDPKPSSVKCAAMPGKESCFFKNVRLDFGKAVLSGGERRPRNGFLSGKCNTIKALPAHSMYRFSGSAQLSPNGDMQCDRWEETPTLLVSHDDIGNTYHNLADFWTMFMALQVFLVKDLSNWQVINMDKRIMCNTVDPYGRPLPKPVLDCEGPYFSQYRAWFGKGIKPATDFAGQKICFSKLLFNAHVDKNHIWHDFWKDSKCKKVYNAEKGGSPLFLGYKHAVLSKFGLLDNPIHTTQVTITYSIRHRKPFQKDPITERTAVNRDELLKMLHEFEASGDSDINVAVRALDMASIPFDEQVATMHDTTILVGFHGAGLTQSIFLPAKKRTAMVELFPYDCHIHGCENIAIFSGVKYFSWRNSYNGQETKKGTIVNVDEIRIVIQKALSYVTTNF